MSIHVGSSPCLLAFGPKTGGRESPRGIRVWATKKFFEIYCAFHREISLVRVLEQLEWVVSESLIKKETGQRQLFLLTDDN